MFYPIKRLSTLLVLILPLSGITYSETVSKDSIDMPRNSNSLLEKNEHQNTISHIDSKIKKNLKILSMTKKSDTTQYMSLYDDTADLILHKNKLLMEMGYIEEIDTDYTCNFILDYAEVEFIKTQYYKTPFHDKVAKTLNNIASLYEQCHPPMAEKYLQSVLMIKENIHSQESSEVAQAHDELGDYYRFSMASFKRAIKHYETAKTIRENLYGKTDPRITKNYYKLAMSLYYHGDKSNQAEKLLLYSIAVRNSSPPNKAFSLYDAYVDIGMYYSIKQKYSDAIRYLKKALAISNDKKGSSYIKLLSELSRMYLNQNDPNLALKYAQEAYNKTKAFYDSSQHPRILEMLHEIEMIKSMK